MLFLRNVLAFLIYIISLSYALQCTTNCSFTSDLQTTFEIPQSCHQLISAKQCTFRVSLWYSTYFSYLSFTADYSNYSSGDFYSTTTRLFDDGSIHFDYSISHYCDHKDNCALEFANKNVPDILRRPNFNYTDMRNELWPLLSSNSSVQNADLLCFDANENLRQCAIVTKPGGCQATQQIMGRRKQMNRTCDYGLTRNAKSITIVDFGRFSSFEVKCNRSFCNGALTIQAVKEIMFKYNVTISIDGQLNNGIRRCLSSTFLILIVLLLRLV